MNLRTLRSTAAVTVLAGALVAGLVSPADAATAPSFEQWQSDVSAVTWPAYEYIQQRIDEASSTSNMAIVLDIDNTSLENYYKGGWQVPATQQVLGIAQAAEAQGVKVFFITARPDVLDVYTKWNLEEDGYPIDGYYSRNPIQLFESVQKFKTGVRAKLESKGYDIIANIGNNWVDINGGYADSTWKLPDYNGLLN
jgi:predicted secreted acid phosphatase